MTRGSEAWTVISPAPTANALNQVIWTGSELIAVGEKGTVVNSKDGISWESQRIAEQSGNFVELSGIANSGHGMVIYSGIPGTAWTSIDGRRWSRIDLGTPARISKLIWTGREYAGVARIAETGGSSLRSVFVSSPDGFKWTSVPTGFPDSVSLYDLAWTGGRFVVIGSRGPSRLSAALDFITQKEIVNMNAEPFVASSPDGNSWDVSVLPEKESESKLPAGVLWNGSQAFVFMRDGTLFTSTDAISWSGGLSLSGTPSNCTWTGREMVLLGLKSVAGEKGWRCEMITSADGLIWGHRLLTPTSTAQYLSVAWTGSQYVAVGRAGCIQTSPDSVTWTVRSPLGNTSNLSKIISHDSQLVAVGRNVASTSIGGGTWTDHDIPGFNAESVAWTGSQFVAIGEGENSFSSPDAVAWIPHKIATPARLHDIAASDTLVVAVGSEYANGPPLVLTSSNGDSWTKEATPKGLFGRLCGVTWTGKQFIAVGDGGLILVSTDGHEWKVTHVGMEFPLLYAVCSSKDRIVAVGVGLFGRPNGYTSLNGVDWEPIKVPFNENLYGVAASGDTFCAVGERGFVLISEDGKTWRLSAVPSSSSLHGVTSSGAHFIVVGGEGVVMAGPSAQE